MEEQIEREEEQKQKKLLQTTYDEWVDWCAEQTILQAENADY